ncbi:Hercynine oxygenase [compost metagenome]
MSENWAISIGINQYDNITALSYARQDAEGIAAFFTENARFKKVYQLTEDAPLIDGDVGPPFQSRPTIGNLLRFMRERFEHPFLKATDNLWFFFAGHGRRDRDVDYLLPLDADPGNVARTGIEVRYVVEQLKKSGAGNVVLLLDACRNLGSRDGSVPGLERQNGAVTISSCSAAEFSYEIDDLHHGAFTYALIEGLRLQGERNCATVERLDAYLQTRVPELCRLHGKPRQTPSTFAEPLSKRHFILLPALAQHEDLWPLKHQALQAEATGDLELAEQMWWRLMAVDSTDAETQEAVRRLARRSTAGKEESAAPPIPVKRAARIILSRRTLACAAGLGAGAVMFRVFLPQWSRSPRGPLQPRQITAVRLDAVGTILPNPETRTIETFEQPVVQLASIEFAVIPGRRFHMGSPPGEMARRDNEEQNWITVSDFAMSRTAITQQQWRAVVQAANRQTGERLSLVPSAFKGEDLPVESVSWVQASQFCSLLAELSGLPYRLPTEAEWEFACRADTDTAFHFGPTLTPAVANYCGTGGAVCGWDGRTSLWSDTYAGSRYEDGAYADGPQGFFANSTKRVRTYPENAFGLFEMHGNVWEHCLDNWTDHSEELPKDGKPFQDGDPGRHPVRGGSWSYNPAICRSAYREPMDQRFRGWQGRVGFRVACSL